MTSRLDSRSRVDCKPRVRQPFCPRIVTPLVWFVAVVLIPLLGLSQQISSTSRGNTQDAAKTTVARPQAPPSEYVIGPTDVLDVSVWKEPDISRTVTVRPDGKISLPLVGELVASGQTPVELQALISHKLANFLTSPEVTVLLHDIRSGTVSIFGKVAKPGAYPLTKQMTVLDVIAAAGGFKDYARLSKIYVLRVMADGTTARYRFNFKQVIKGHDISQNIQVEPKDAIYVP